MEKENDYLAIINYFGVNNQQRKLQEEVFELQEAKIKFESGIGDIHDVEEELVDVTVILHEFMELYEMDGVKLAFRDRAKVERTIERIRNGYYTKKEH